MSDTDKDFVLVVDDNPDNIQFLANILSDTGYEVAIAMSGQETYDFVKDELPDIILLDVMMPEIDGYQVCRRLKSGQRTKDIPIIFLTAKADPEDIVKGFKNGAVDYLTKPFNATELIARIETHISLKRARERIETLEGLIPICAWCKKVRDGGGFWQDVEEYIRDRTRADFSHGLCPHCVVKQREKIRGIRTQGE